MKDSYGVPRDIYAKIKILGIFLMDIVFVSLTGVLAFTFGMKLFPPQEWPIFLVFWLLSVTLVIYLLLPIRGGKKNWQSILLFFRRRRKRYISINHRQGGKHGA
ncbi:DUF5592 family protein [Streptococcus agalactiae]|uniref:DUF5592 family protein n=1 Tax=Streptococcus agalactiae TaxID=1311 RepID=UPI0002BC005C|nr:DUF5592 family protein [Streptococcus agalactiae]EPT35483.1 hypothetical protein SAG0021_03530 [Streptococcus agalactiae FSL S3-277]